MAKRPRATGHVQVKGPPGRRGYYALWRDANGRHQRLLGPAHVKDSGRRTPRGAVVWRAGDGPKPTAEHLTPREADGALAAILSEAPTVLPAVSEVAVTFEEACMEWLRYVERDRQRAPSTVADYRYAVNTHLQPAFGASTPVAQIDTEAVDAFRERLLADGGLSRRTVQKTLVLFHGVMNRAVRRKWIETRTQRPSAST